jgi:hypothetical protein
MKDRTEPAEFIIQLADESSDDKEYQVTFRAWQLRELSNYIKKLEKQNGKP